jgi:hypothetical protein
MSEPHHVAPTNPAPTPPAPTSPAPATPYPYASTAPAAGGPSNPLAVASVVLGVVAVALGVVNQLATIALLQSSDFALYRVLSGMFSFAMVLTGLAALVLGLVAGRRPAGRLRAGIGIGLGAAVSTGVLVGFAVNAVLSVLP